MKTQTADVKFTIRDYRAADFDRLWQIDQSCFPAGVAYTQMELMGFIARRKAITMVAEEHAPHAGSEKAGDGSSTPLGIVGFVVALPLRGRIGHVVTLDIMPEARRFGLASRLMHECEHRLRAAGCSQIYLETAVNNGPAMRLYRKLGYEIVRTLPGYYSSQDLDAFQMLKHL
ncbi:MAG: GNAT family N-acetyltransferase [Candidatus Korobacteraceae bacterium]|jgi:ribosomal-protein-alanine N-acetyltransferase